MIYFYYIHIIHLINFCFIWDTCNIYLNIQKKKMLIHFRRTASAFLENDYTSRFTRRKFSVRKVYSPTMPTFRQPYSNSSFVQAGDRILGGLDRVWGRLVAVEYKTSMPMWVRKEKLTVRDRSVFIFFYSYMISVFSINTTKKKQGNFVSCLFNVR